MSLRRFPAPVADIGGKPLVKDSKRIHVFCLATARIWTEQLRRVERYEMLVQRELLAVGFELVGDVVASGCEQEREWPERRIDRRKHADVAIGGVWFVVAGDPTTPLRGFVEQR
jgi:hypothetical protein